MQLAQPRGSEDCAPFAACPRGRVPASPWGRGWTGRCRRPRAAGPSPLSAPPAEEVGPRAPEPSPRAPATMSWVQAAVSRPSEDVFDEDADEMHLIQKEWKSTMEKRIKEGYRDGVEAGKERALQQGFNQGYREGAKMMRTCGQFKGILNALLSWCHLNGHDSALLSKINDLLDAVGKYEEHVLKCLNSVHPQPHLGELLDSVQDMDLSCTIPAEEEFNGTKSERPCGSGATFSESCFRSNEKKLDSSLNSCSNGTENEYKH
ncbi:yae1 domain-containing protein 1 isoform X2 [Alligator sinensis]|uniref:Yae1 domain-containing protein 1 isoform X2 n=1 Tax=Alligator sinensis TaxID=38654 RepID=A0A3Q0G836_ALLSI|nr:yae1 domain-containing protein 1 isoform X2 [Alligator sinensis]